MVNILVRDKLVENSRVVGSYLLEKLQEKVLPFWFVGDVRGKGLMQGIEFVRDKKTKEPFPVGLGVADKVTQKLINHGIIVYPGSGNADGENGDQFLLAPPLILTKDQADEIVAAMVAAFGELEKELR